MSAVEASERLVGAPAFEVLRRQLAGQEEPQPARFCEPAFVRLADALHLLRVSGASRPSALDLAILVRHVLRYHELQTGGPESVFLQVSNGQGWPSALDWSRIGVEAHPVPAGFRVRAYPWRPTWLPNVRESGVDAAAAAEEPRRRSAPVPGDPFLVRFRRAQYRSLGQRSAVRAALTTPPGSTLLICLPTGDGKSTVFQVVGDLGFDGSALGVTVVVTPTVALALDQERSARELGFSGYRLAYRGGDATGGNRDIFEGIANGTQKLCFASPEALYGPLQPALLQAARTGLLRALVVDEAHLIETWGINFRTEFQLLAGLRQAILQEAGGSPPRTLLLSATISQQTISTLKALFGTGPDGAESFSVYAAPYLRPEIEYWVAQTSDEGERRRRVLDAVLHAPRPAILYVTEKAHANQWLKALRKEGFCRVARVTGDTPLQERQAAIEGWSQGTIDLVVGTSAFGIGIDNAHVRTVIHACVPETLDRFYQEVGRGGRDGRTSISLILPTQADVEMAYSLNNPKVITTDLGFDRWKAMFSHPDRTYDHGTDTHLVRLDVAPGIDTERIDMVSDRSTGWNVRTLILMAGAGMITLLGPESRAAADPPKRSGEPATPIGQYHPYQRVRILEPRHLDRSVWDVQVQEQRQKLLASNRDNLDRLLLFLKASNCAAELIAPLYEVEGFAQGSGDRVNIHVARACGGCPHCRAKVRQPYQRPTRETPFPWQGAAVTRGPGVELLDESNRVVVFYPTPSEGLSAKLRRRMVDELTTLIRNSAIRNVIIPPGAPLNKAELQEQMPFWPLFVSDHISRRNLPPGPTVVMVPPGERIPAAVLAPRPASEARFLFIPENADDPDAPAVPLLRRYGGRQLTLDQFIR